MAQVFGDDPGADARWLSFLDSRILPVALRNRLLRAGITPDTLLAGDPLPETARDLEVDRLRRALGAARPARIDNGVDPALPIVLITVADAVFPELLAACDDAPAALFVVGDPAQLNGALIAMVGSRSPSLDGRRAARFFARSLAAAGVGIASGLALGIDAEAHRGALDAGGPTIAVLPTGVDRVYPGQHRNLARDIARAGAVVSEFLPGTLPDRFRFPRRNHTLSGLALGTLVVEAGRPSGTLITAGAAASQGREVMALPWSLFHAGGAGNRALLADGATLVQAPADVLHAVGARVPAAVATPQDTDAGSDAAGSLLGLIGDGEVTFEGLLAAVGGSPSALSQALAELEIEGRVVRTHTGYRAIGAGGAGAAVAPRPVAARIPPQ